MPHAAHDAKTFLKMVLRSPRNRNSFDGDFVARSDFHQGIHLGGKVKWIGGRMVELQDTWWYLNMTIGHNCYPYICTVHIKNALIRVTHMMISPSQEKNIVWMGKYTRYEHNVIKCSIYRDMWKQYNVQSNSEIMWSWIKDVKKVEKTTAKGLILKT